VKTLSLLGSTGSIGIQVLEIVREFGGLYRIAGLTAGRNIRLLREQILTFRPRCVSVATASEAQALTRNNFPGYPLTVLWGSAGHEIVATLPETDMVISAMVGAVGLLPTVAAIKARKTIALANKEALVMAGALVMEEARKQKVTILPIDSEHSAIFQLLRGNRKQPLRRIILTASGGPFWKHTRERIKKITSKEALKHPNWKMGPKITIDSATLMNKGLEVMEAHWLFNVALDRISITIHPQSIVHSLIEFQDGSLLAQMGPPDMAIPIAYALAFPKRLPLKHDTLDLTRLEGLTFHQPDLEKFPCLRLALEAGREGGSWPIVLNAANEVAVSAFLKGVLPFIKIPVVIQEILNRHKKEKPENLEAVMGIDLWARKKAQAWIKKRN
jgi:1-deoxy-D-xylulose-5-phosphate reductoisomerase